MRDLRSKLDRLTRGPGAKRAQAPARRDPSGFSTREVKRTLRRQQETSPSRPDSAIVYRRDLPRTDAPRHTNAAAHGPKVVLCEAVKGREIEYPGLGRSYLISTPVRGVSGAALVDDAFQEDVSCGDSNLGKRLRLLCDPSGLTPDDFIFMDLETAGLGNAPLFLVGIMVWREGGFEVRQHLARNYAEEAAVIMHYLDACEDKKVLVSFNGKSFDVPYVRTRAAAHGLPHPAVRAHFDLLHESRRVWKAELPDCKLQTLERHICGRVRHGDIPGSQIPDAYHAYVRTDDARDIVVVLKHNLLDLITLADLMTRFPDMP